MSIEIILPVRNPTAVFRETIKSLLAQSDRRFSVIISDNYSTSGKEFIVEALEQFLSAGVTIRKVQPPAELGRVEHWNWVHDQSEAEWIKPIFAGDWLEPNYLMRLREIILKHPDLSYVFTNYTLHLGKNPPEAGKGLWTDRVYSSEEMTNIVLRNGMQFGPPSGAAYRKAAFVSVGGYAVLLPICADSLLFCTLASKFGAYGFSEPLLHFNIHEARFSTGLKEKRRQSFYETVVYLLMLGSDAHARKVPFSKVRFARLLAAQVRNYLFGR